MHRWTLFQKNISADSTKLPTNGPRFDSHLEFGLIWMRGSSVPKMHITSLPWSLGLSYEAFTQDQNPSYSPKAALAIAIFISVPFGKVMIIICCNCLLTIYMYPYINSLFIVMCEGLWDVHL